MRIIVALAVVALGAAWYASLPPRGRALPAASEGQVAPVRGAIHVHTSRSDGTGTVEEVAAAAARAGLTFVVLTDHGDATRRPRRPQYHAGVLVIDAVEMSTDEGHVVALGLPAAPYPLGGEARDVVEDVRRLGGFSIAAHPGSSKGELSWQDWTVPIGGLEWLNGDSEWRNESAWSLARALFTYPARPTETLVSLLDRPDEVLRRWDELTRERRVVAVAAVDAHARIGLRSLGEPYDNLASFRLPAYDRTFRALSIALPHTTLRGDATADAAAVLDAIRGGRLYSALDGLAGPAGLSFTATSGEANAFAGDVLPLAEAVTLRVEVQAPPEARIDLWKDGAVVASGGGTALEHAASGAGVYRVEVSLPDAPGDPPVPWLVSNPIYVGREPREPSAPAARRPATEYRSRYTDGDAAGWAVERSAASAGEWNVAAAIAGTQLTFRYALGGRPSDSPYAALVMPAGEDLAGYDRLVFTARATQPMRVSVQFRAPGGAGGERWHRSVVLDSEPREITVWFDDLRPRGETTRRTPPLPEVDAVLFVVDTVNTELGGRGQIWIDNVRYAR